ncbi:LRR receptor-like serine/threonine-protein kinase ERECTA [Actinidia eriantha]|uniref:LRR receptor-like serine/threonine-protein kinase ERECTA n=1 Tax=Actinidia eriantha TaxID=165200 RepID=UPI00258FA69D|nr:LRR receptor-like serine/threonine-protein kinase ERECTA [Actinidia eriantha]
MASSSRPLGVTIFLLFMGCFSFGFVFSDDGASLLKIMKSFRDVDNVLYDWTDSPSSDYCVWRVVTCDNVTFSVVALNLSGLNLDGEISPVIGELKSLISMDLSFNELYGDIPFSISKLKQLEYLILKNNQLIGPIPSTLSQIPNLKVLDLAHNKLSGEIPGLIYWNEVLQYLGLQGNNLVGTLSSDMCQLTGLWYLDLSFNQLTGEIPFNIGFLQVATLYVQLCKYLYLLKNALDLSCNMLSGHIPRILRNLTCTEKLYLHGNKLTGSIPPELGNMTKLHYLICTIYGLGWYLGA